MKIKSNYLFIIIGLVMLGYLVGGFGMKAVQGLLWNVHITNYQLVWDKYYCHIKLDVCTVNQKTLEQNIGVYDFNQTFGDSDQLAFDHIYIDWNDSSAAKTLPTQYSKSAEKNRWVLLTIEPYPQSNGDMFDQIQNGTFDATIKQICTVVDNAPNPVFIRWGHEMENVTGRYPWAVDDPAKYIDGYNYFVQTCKNVTDNAFYVWSPAGDRGLEKYWPGEENVDYVGLSLYIYDTFEKDYYGHIRSFDQAFGERYERVKHYNKPIMIAEFGIQNVDDLQQYWWYNASKSLHNYPLLKTIVYFNAIDTAGVWGDYETPDWSIDPTIFPGE